MEVDAELIAPISNCDDVIINKPSRFEYAELNSLEVYTSDTLHREVMWAVTTPKGNGVPAVSKWPIRYGDKFEGEILHTPKKTLRSGEEYIVFAEVGIPSVGPANLTGTFIMPMNCVNRQGE